MSATERTIYLYDSKSSHIKVTNLGKLHSHPDALPQRLLRPSLLQAATVNVTVGHIPKFIPIYRCSQGLNNSDLTHFFHRPTKLRLNEVYIEIYVM